MTGNPRSSPYYSLPRAKRRRRGVEITLSDKARAKLDRLAEREYDGNRSAAVEALIEAVAWSGPEQCASDAVEKQKPRNPSRDPGA